VKWQAVTRHDGSRGHVNTTTGELVDSLTEALGLWSLDLELRGLLAEAETDDEAA
jgi:hypothetical protein